MHRRVDADYVIDWGPGYRIYLAKDGDSPIVLFGGGTKRRQQADIEGAKALHAEYKARKAATLAERPGASDRRGKRDGIDAGFQEDSCRSSRA
jgi:hypothetical protein